MAQWPAGSAPASEDRAKQIVKKDSKEQYAKILKVKNEQKRRQLDVAVQAAAHPRAGRSLTQQTTRIQGRRNPRCMKKHIDTLQRIVHIESYFMSNFKLAMLRIKRCVIK